VTTGEVRLLVLLTKCDKLARRAAAASLRTVSHALESMASEDADIGVTLFSALKHTGVGDVTATLRAWVRGASATGQG
jgi:GTP-binding protein